MENLEKKLDELYESLEKNDMEEIPFKTFAIVLEKNNSKIVSGDLYKKQGVFKYDNITLPVSDITIIHKYCIILNETYREEHLEDVLEYIFAADPKEAKEKIKLKYTDKYGSKIRIKEIYETWQ